jgi:hypothetical protein
MPPASAAQKYDLALSGRQLEPGASLIRMAQPPPGRLAVSFTGGKDSTLVLTVYQLLAAEQGSKLAATAAALPQAIKQRFLPESASGQGTPPPRVAVLVTFVPVGE